MPETDKPKGTPPPKDPAPSGAAPQGSPAPAAKAAPFDLGKYRSAAAKADEKAERETKTRGPKVKLGDLAGLDGFGARDAFEGDSDEFGHYGAVTVVAPDGAEAIALSNAESGPGRAIIAAIRQGLFDDPTTVVPVHVRKVPSTKNFDPQTGKPFVRVLVTFG